MAKRWTSDDDAFLLRWHEAAGADFVASHDLGRPDGAGSRRIRVLDRSGASVLFAHAMLANLDWLEAVGHVHPDWAKEDREFWNANLGRALQRVMK